MDNRNFGSVVIIDDAREAVGISTERDLFKRLAARNLNPAETRAGEVMTDHVKIASATDDVVEGVETNVQRAVQTPTDGR